MALRFPKLRLTALEETPPNRLSHFLRLSCLGICACLFAISLGDERLVGAERNVASRPNIVVILADDMGYGDVQELNPDSTIPTPNLNRLAASGMKFTDAHSPSAVCTPTRYGLLTGRYCWRSRLKKGVLGGYSPPLIEEGRKTIADMLRSAGYQTGAVGKWHLGMALPKLDEDADTSKWAGDPGIDFHGVITNGPTHHGFDSYFGVSASLDMAPYVYIQNDKFASIPTIQQEAVKFPHFIRSGPRSADFVVEEVLDRLTNEATGFIAKASERDEPYFLYMPLTGPHKPTQPHPRFRGKTSLKEYGDFVHQVDWTVGRVLDAVEASGKSDNTLVVFTSDNGSYMYRYDDPDKRDHVDDVSIQGFRKEHHAANGVLRGTKADVWEAGHRVPCFVSWPSRVEPGTACDVPVCLTDIYATAAAVVETQLDDDQAEDSFSWLPLMEGKSAERGGKVVNHSISGVFAIRDGKWKLVCGNGSGGREKPKGTPFEKPFKLFDLSSDIAEADDVASQFPDVVDRLTSDLEKIMSSGRSR